jgi:hypothetical protein
LTLAPGFVPPPRVASVSVASGPASGGTTVAITGTGFTGATAVTFGDAPAASFVVNGDTSITAVSPATIGGTVDVTVTTAGGTSAASPADEFTFVAAPVVSGLSPDSGTVDGGTIVTITGASLGDATGVDFGGTPAGFTVIDDATISAISPPGEAPDTVRVRVTSLGGTSANSPANVFTYTASTGCGGACPPPPPSIVCGRLAGNLARSLTVARCTPRSTTERRASLTTDFTTLTWKPSGETTVLSLTATSPGQGACRTGGTEYDLTGTVVGGTSSYVPAGEAVSGQICLSPRGHVTLVKGTTFDL